MGKRKEKSHARAAGMTAIGISLPVSLKRELESLAGRENRSLTGFILKELTRAAGFGNLDGHALRLRLAEAATKLNTAIRKQPNGVDDKDVWEAEWLLNRLIGDLTARQSGSAQACDSEQPANVLASKAVSARDQANERLG